MNLQIGNIVRYKDDYIPNRKWYLLDLYNNLCRIALIRNNNYKHIKDNIEYINANIVNLDINKIEKYED